MQESGIYNDKRIKRGENLITFDGGLKTGKHDWKKEMDVISFTFSSRSAIFLTNYLLSNFKLLQQEFKKMREMMIYQLVDKEMSSIEGSWLCFEKDGVGIDIEGEIVSTLVDELVNDLVSGVQRKTSRQGN
ncbi:unnamed protein product, partial [Brassica oleracea]